MFARTPFEPPYSQIHPECESWSLCSTCQAEHLHFCGFQAHLLLQSTLQKRPYLLKYPHSFQEFIRFPDRFMDALYAPVCCCSSGQVTLPFLSFFFFFFLARSLGPKPVCSAVESSTSSCSLMLSFRFFFFGCFFSFSCCCSSFLLVFPIQLCSLVFVSWISDSFVVVRLRCSLALARSWSLLSKALDLDLLFDLLSSSSSSPWYLEDNQSTKELSCWTVQ